MEYVSERFRKGSYFLVFATFILILLGSYVNAIGAGLSCPDWPFCYGKVFPFFDESIDTGQYTPLDIFSEWFHRLWAALLGFYLLALTFFARHYRKSIPTIFRQTLLLNIFFGVQVLLGAVTVLIAQVDGITREERDLTVVAHLGNAVLIIILEMTLAFYSTINSSSFKSKMT